MYVCVLGGGGWVVARGESTHKINTHVCPIGTQYYSEGKVLTDFLAISMSGPLALPGLSDLVGKRTWRRIISQNEAPVATIIND